jgi:cytochrome c oxidase assembly factor CtaG
VAAAPPSLWTLSTPSSVDVVPVVLVGAAVAAYVIGVRRLAARGRRWPAGRTLAFVSGSAVLLLATETGLARYDTVLFSLHVVQHVLLAMVAPVLLVLGAPLTLALQSASPRNRMALRRALASRLGGVATNPLVALVAFSGTLFVLYFTPLYELSLRHDAVHAWVHIHFVVTGFLFAAAVIGLDELRHRPSFPARLGIVLATVPAHAFLGVALLSARVPVAAEWYASIGRAWGGTALQDQRLGAGILWVTGEVFGLTLACVVLVQWMAHSEREGRRHDRILDAGLAAR